MSESRHPGTPAERLGVLAFALKLLTFGLVTLALGMLGLDLVAGQKAGIPASLIIAIGGTAFAQIGCWIGYRALTTRKHREDRP